jgi:hypothetical protein
MTWIIRQGRKSDSARVTAEWDEHTTIYDVTLGPGERVAKTSFGGASRSEMTAATKPVEGIFRWAEGTPDPAAVLRWREHPDGPVLEQAVPLGK